MRRRCSRWSDATKRVCGKRCVLVSFPNATLRVKLTLGGSRAQADEAETKLNAKLDILTRLQAAKTPGRGGATAHRLREESLTPSTTYDDSDEEDVSEEEEAGGATEREDHLAAEEDEEEGTNNDSEEVERMLMPGAEDTDVSRLSFRVTLCVVQTVS